MNLTVEKGERSAALPVERLELVTVGRIAKPQGRFGEVAINPASDSPERFIGLSRLFLERDGGRPEEFTVESMRIHKGRPIAKLTDISSIEMAQSLSGRGVAIPAAELEPTPDDTFYHYELVGLEAHDDRHGLLGRVTEILSTGGTDVVVVTAPDASEILLPLCSEICRRVDLDAGRLEIHAPDGLLDINAR